MVAASPLTNEGYSVSYSETSLSFNGAKRLNPPYVAVMAGPFVDIYNDSTPSSPSFVSRIELPSDARDVAYSSLGLLLVADGPSGLLIYNLADPASPMLVGVFRKYDAVSAAVSEDGKFAYVTPGDSYFYVVKITSPANPRLQRTRTYNNAVISQLLVPSSSGKTLLVAAGPKGLLSYSIQHPRNPEFLARVRSLDATVRISESSRTVAVTDSHQGLVLVNYPSWDDPNVKGSLKLTPNIADCAFLKGGQVAVVAQGTGGASVIDTSDPDYPVVVSNDASLVNSRAVWGDGEAQVAFVLCGSNGLWTVDTGNPSSPTVNQFLPGKPSFSSIASKNNIAYVTAGDTIRVYDFSAPSSPTVSTTLTLPGTPEYLTVDGNLLFASCGNTGLRIYDVSTPSAPIYLSTVATPASPGQVSVAGTLAAVAVPSEGVTFVDISDPVNPAILSTWSNKPSITTGVAFSSPTVIWVTSTLTLKSLDVTDPTSPKDLDTTTGTGHDGYLKVIDGFLYLASRDEGLRVYRISDPKSPKKLYEVNTGNAYDLNVNSTVMILSNGDYGVREYDLTDSKLPAPTAQFETPGFVSGAAVLDNGTVVAAATNGGLWALTRTGCPGTDLLLPCDDAWISPHVAPIFTWTARTNAKYKIKICQDPAFPSKKTFTGLIDNKAFSTPFWAPGKKAWKKIRKKGRGQATLYWRVAFIESGVTTYSATRSLTVY